ncbi:MAG: hypothetical protein NC180_06520 [Muribaculaceae bacterium]|nr:hypothetical protein [Roseburia sp.]MCM1429811.1 hypothetical protein [Muribaculaceae bacterium]MCM1492862.1 hypothetical protein [Muribaculaceae bacterium]
MAQNMPKRKIKDSVFTNLFQDKKYLLCLYKALHPEDSDVTEDDIKDVTIKHILVDADYNDLGFSVGDRLVVLVESQSTWTLNIIIRALMYLIQTYHDFFKRTRQNLYGSKKVNMPTPELYVIFTGEKPNSPPDTISLSKDFFGGEKIAIDAEVKVLYQEDESSIIGQYIIFCKVYNEQRKKYGQTKQAVTETIRICKDRNVLREYFENKEKEVVDIMMTLFDDEEIWDAYAKDIEDSVTLREARKTAERMIRKGKMSLEEIADCVPSLSLDVLKEIETEVMQLA